SVLVDPFAGGRLLPPAGVAELARSAGVEPEPAHLAPWPPTEILLRMLNNIRQLAAAVEHARTRLWAVELALLLPRHPLALRREHGELLAGLGDLLGGAAELTAYAEAVAPVDPNAAEAALHEARLARARLNSRPWPEPWRIFRRIRWQLVSAEPGVRQSHHLGRDGPGTSGGARRREQNRGICRC
ncbi:MAG: transglutaminase family protein, partial [Mycobacteriales bacterium]